MHVKKSVYRLGLATTVLLLLDLILRIAGPVFASWRQSESEAYSSGGLSPTPLTYLHYASMLMQLFAYMTAFSGFVCWLMPQGRTGKEQVNDLGSNSTVR